MSGYRYVQRSVPVRIGLVALIAAGMILVAGLIGAASVGIASVFTGAGTPTGWDQINAAFGVVNSVFSALALIVVAATLWVQYRMQRLELKEQRRGTEKTAEAAQNTAEAELRARHVELLKMAIDDRALADVWPPFGDGVSRKRARQYLYANLVLQHQALALRAARRDPEYVRRVVTYCFASPIIREFWGRTKVARRQIAATHEHVQLFEQICDEVYSTATHVADGRTRHISAPFE
jgi:uncharacterized membrane protein